MQAARLGDPGADRRGDRAGRRPGGRRAAHRQGQRRRRAGRAPAADARRPASACWTTSCPRTSRPWSATWSTTPWTPWARWAAARSRSRSSRTTARSGAGAGLRPGRGAGPGRGGLPQRLHHEGGQRWAARLRAGPDLDDLHAARRHGRASATTTGRCSRPACRRRSSRRGRDDPRAGRRRRLHGGEGPRRVRGPGARLHGGRRVATPARTRSGWSPSCAPTSSCSTSTCPT